MEKKKGSLAKYKEACDFIYEATVKPEGYHGSFNRIGRLHALVAIEFVKRGIIKIGGSKAAPVYTWAATGQHPTNCLYSSVAESIRKQARESQARSYQRKKQRKEFKPAVVEGKKTENAVPVEEKETQWVERPLTTYRPEELWLALKSLGYEIVDGRLAKFLN